MNMQTKKDKKNKHSQFIDRWKITDNKRYTIYKFKANFKKNRNKEDKTETFSNELNSAFVVF